MGKMPKTTKLVSGTNIRRTRFVLSEAWAFLTTVPLEEVDPLEPDCLVLNADSLGIRLFASVY